MQDFIASGIINEYCLGLLPPDEIREVERMASLYPEVQQAVDEARQALKPLENQRLPPNDKLKSRILGALSKLGEAPAFDLNQLPLINPYSDSDQWQRTVATIRPPRDFRNLCYHPLREKDGIAQFLLWVKQEIRAEEHHGERESFLILEGECECQIGDETIRLLAGDYVEIPLAVVHTVRVLSPTPVKAIVQRINL